MNGILLVDKPEGWTSHDVVGKLRSVLHEKRIGHSGTLDPMATGLLVVFVGRATRAVEFAEADSKEYLAGLRLGVSTDTQDTTGKVLSETDSIPTETELLHILPEFTGTISQLPPMYSAIKVNGKKLYELARRGETVERKPREITIHALELLYSDGRDSLLRVACSKGTYVRTLCHDIGSALGCGGCMSRLRRTKAGTFSVDDAHTVDEIQALSDAGRISEILLPVDRLFAGHDSLIVDPSEERKLRCGNVIKSRATDGKYRVYAESGEFLLLAEVQNGCLKTIKSFFEVTENNNV